MTVSWILDIAAVAVVALLVFLGVRRGFIRTAVHLIGGLVALVAAALLSVPAAQWVYDSVLAAPLTAFASEQAQTAAVAAATTLQGQIDAVMAGIPPFWSNLFTVVDTATVTAQGGALAAAELTSLLVEAVLRPVCVTLTQTVVFLLIFVIVCLLMRLLGGALHKVFAALPFINRVNDTLGGVLGFGEGLLVVYLLTLLLELYMTMAGAGSVVTPADIEATYLLRYFTDVSVSGTVVFGS